MSGLQLGEMEASEMLDVIHVLFEEDYTTVVNAEQVEVKNRLRKVIYKEFYDKSYNYTAKNEYELDGSIDSPVDYSDVKPFDPKAATRKPYIPPTQFNPEAPQPFGKNIDAPLG